MKKKFLLIPDSFKGTMDSTTICNLMREQILGFYPDADVVPIPVADGGEGSVDAFLTALSGEKVFLQVSGPFGESVNAFYGIVNGNTAVIEMAACAGLPLVGSRPDPCATTTYGVGELIFHAIRVRKCTKVIVGLGGSCTNDAGAGMASALGVRFYNQDGKCFVPTGGTLKDINHIDCSGVDGFLNGVEIMAMCDIDNPLYGPNGAAYVFSPQKGANAKAVTLLDDGLQHIGKVIQTDLGMNVSSLLGAGAAGGMGAGMKAFLGAGLQSGIQTVLDTVRFDELLEGADLVFTGEGKLDSQSLHGKVVIGVAQRAQKAGVPVIAVVGDIGDSIEEAYDLGVTAVFSINRVAVPYTQAKSRSRSDLCLTMCDILRLLKCARF